MNLAVSKEMMKKVGCVFGPLYMRK